MDGDVKEKKTERLLLVLRFYAVGLFIFLYGSTIEASWINPDCESKEFPIAWDLYQKAMAEGDRAESWSELTDSEASYTFYKAFKKLEYAMRAYPKMKKWEGNESVLKKHISFYNCQLHYMATGCLCFPNYRQILSALHDACKLDDSEYHLWDKKTLIQKDTNYNWMFQYAKAMYAFANDEEGFKKALHAAFLCFMRIMLYGREVPMDIEDQGRIALKLCALISKIYGDLYIITSDEKYLKSEVFAQETYIWLAFDYENHNFFDPYNDDCNARYCDNSEEDEEFEEDEYPFRDQFIIPRKLEMNAKHVWHFIDTAQFKRIREKKLGRQLTVISLEVLLSRGKTSLSRSCFKDAIKYFELAMDYFPCSGEAHTQLGIMHFIDHDYDEAIDHFYKAISQGYEHANAFKMIEIAENKLKN